MKKIVTIYRQKFQSMDPIILASEMLVLLLWHLREATTRKGTAKRTRKAILSLGINGQRWQSKKRQSITTLDRWNRGLPGKYSLKIQKIQLRKQIPLPVRLLEQLLGGERLWQLRMPPDKDSRL